jgi:hypothetical protein
VSLPVAVWKWGLTRPPFPYGDHRYHAGIRHNWIPVTIRGSRYGNGDCHIPIWERGSPFPYGDCKIYDPRFHMGITIWKWGLTRPPFPYGDHRYHTGI